MVSLRRSSKKHQEVAEECVKTNEVRKRSFLKKSSRRKKSEDGLPDGEESSEVTDTVSRKELLETVGHKEDESPSDPDTKVRKVLKVKSKPSVVKDGSKKFSFRKLKFKKKKGESANAKEMGIIDEETAERDAQSIDSAKVNDDAKSAEIEERDLAPVDSEENDSENVQNEHVSRQEENEKDNNGTAYEDEKLGVKVMEEAGSLLDEKSSLASPSDQHVDLDHANSKFFDSITSKFKKKKQRNIETDNEHIEEPSEVKEVNMNEEVPHKSPSKEFDELATISSHSEDDQDISRKRSDEENMRTEQDIVEKSSETEPKSLCMSLGRMDSDEKINDGNKGAFMCGGINKDSETFEGEENKFSCGALKKEQIEECDEIENDGIENDGIEKKVSEEDGTTRFCATLNGPQQILSNKTEVLCNVLDNGDKDSISLEAKGDSGKSELSFGVCSPKKEVTASGPATEEPAGLGSLFCCV